MSNRIRTALWILGLFSAAACTRADLQKIVESGSGGSSTTTTTTTTTTAALSCSASLNGVARSGANVTVSLSLSGGEPPYLVNGTSTTFTGSTTLVRQYTIASLVESVSDSIQVKDKLGASVTCSWRTLVSQNEVSQSGTLGCAIGATPSSPSAGQTVSFRVMAMGGTAPYFLNLAYGNGYGRSGWSQTGSEVATSSFPIAGTTASRLEVRDSAGRFGQCFMPMTVRTPPSVSLVASPSQQVGVGETVTLSASAQGFLNPSVSYSFTSSDPGVVITQNGSTATARSADGKYHSAAITVSASSAGESASSSVPLTFALQNVSCEVRRTFPLDDPFVDEDVQFMTLMNGDVVSATSFDPGAGGALQTSASSPVVRVRYGTGGTKTVRVFARDPATLTPCNGGNALTLTVPVRRPVACETVMAASAPNFSNLAVAAAIPVGFSTGPANVKIVSISAPATAGLEILSQASRLNWAIRFRNEGTHAVTVRVRDEGDPSNTHNEVDCPVRYHTSTLGTALCSLSFKDHQGLVVSSVRAHNPVTPRVGSTMQNGYVALAPGADAVTSAGGVLDTGFVFKGSFPADTYTLRHTQNSTAPVTAVATVKKILIAGQQALCSAQLSFTAPLSCSLAKTESEILVANRVSLVHDGITGERGFSDSYYLKDGVVGFQTRGTATQVTTANSQGAIRYALGFSGLPSVIQASNSTSVSLTGQFSANGVYALRADVTDSLDNIGNRCELDDANKTIAQNRLVVNSMQDIFFQKQGGASFVFGEYCRLWVTNRGNRNNAIWHFNPLISTIPHTGDLHNIGVNQTKSVDLFRSGSQCAIRVKALGAHKYLSTDLLPNGPVPFDLRLEVRVKQNGVYRSVYYDLKSL
jgi:hypothetical protein